MTSPHNADTCQHHDCGGGQQDHVHRPMMAVMTCQCGSRAVFVEEDRLEAFDHNWAGLDKFFAKKAATHDQPQ